MSAPGAAPGVDVERLRALVERLRFEREPVPPDSRLHSYREGLRDAAVMIEAALTSADGAGTQGWRPIETAPKDGEDVLVHWDRSGIMQVASCWRGIWTDANDDEVIQSPPTHWQPLPAAMPVDEGERS